jgi:UDP-glucose 4-epimerase
VATILVTGATGFVGGALVPALAAAGHRVVRIVRETAMPGDLAVPELLEWRPEPRDLAGIDAIVHLAARTHVMHESSADPLAAYRALNVGVTARLAAAAAQAGVRRFVFLSSIKVNGEATHGRAFTADDAPHPEDAYGVSKREAEDGLRDIAHRTGLEVVVLRPPLVYGPGVKGNLRALMHAIDRGMPLPLASIANRRSLVGIDNLVSAIALAATHPSAAGRTFLVSDGEDLSTPELVRAIAAGLGRRARLLPCPVALLRLAGRVTGRGAAIDRLAGSLEVDASALRQALGWQPLVPPAVGLARMAGWYHAHTPTVNAD